MKKKHFLYFILFFLFSCKKESNTLVSKYWWGEVTGVTLNGSSWPSQKDWNIKIAGRKFDTTANCNFRAGSVLIATYQGNDLWRETIGIGAIPLKVGKFIFTNNDPINNLPGTCLLGATLFLSTADGDADVGDYVSTTGIESSVTISSYDTITSEVRGSFDITFVKKYRSSDYYTNYTDTVRFNNGQFHTRWIK